MTVSPLNYKLAAVDICLQYVYNIRHIYVIQTDLVHMMKVKAMQYLLSVLDLYHFSSSHPEDGTPVPKHVGVLYLS